MSEKYKCAVCKKFFDASGTYEYRGEYSCAAHFDEMEAARNFQRQEIMAEEDAKTAKFRGLDLSLNTVIGKANRKLLAQQIQVASKESGRIKAYENRELK